MTRFQEIGLRSSPGGEPHSHGQQDAQRGQQLLAAHYQGRCHHLSGMDREHQRDQPRPRHAETPQQGPHQPHVQAVQDDIRGMEAMRGESAPQPALQPQARVQQAATSTRPARPRAGQRRRPAGPARTTGHTARRCPAGGGSRRYISGRPRPSRPHTIMGRKAQTVSRTSATPAEGERTIGGVMPRTGSGCIFRPVPLRPYLRTRPFCRDRESGGKESANPLQGGDEAAPALIAVKLSCREQALLGSEARA